MKKIFFSIMFLLVGVLVFTIAGCSDKGQTNINSTADDLNISDVSATESPDKFYNSVEEIVAPVGMVSELKSIFSEACGAVKLTTLDYDFPAEGADMLVYAWKNKPTEEELISALEKNGYKIEASGGGGMLYVKKGNIDLTVDWDSPDREGGNEIVVLVTK